MAKKYYGLSYGKKRSKRPLILLLCFCIALVLFFRNTIASNLLDMYIGILVKKNSNIHLLIDHKEQGHGRLCFNKVHFTSDTLDVEIDQISIYTSVDIFPFSITIHVDIQTPRIKVLQKQTGVTDYSFLAHVFFHRYIHVKMDVKEGSIHLANSLDQPLCFSYVTQDIPGHIGRFILQAAADSGSSPLCVVQLLSVGDHLKIDADIASNNLSLVEPLLDYFPFKENARIENVEGSLSLHAECLLNPSGHIEELQASLDVENLMITTSHLLRSLIVPFSRAEFFYRSPSLRTEEFANDPFWKKIEGSLSVSGVECLLDYGSDIALHHLQGQVVLSNREDPSITLSGVLNSGIEHVPFELASTGSIDSNQNFWWQAQLSCPIEKQPPALLNLSICKVDEISYVLQTDFSHFNRQIIGLCSDFFDFSKSYKIEADSFDGSLTSWFHSGDLARLHWSDLSASGLSFNIEQGQSLIGMSGLNSKGEMIKEKGIWQIKSLAYAMDKGFIQQQRLQLSDITSSINFAEGMLALSKSSGHWNGGMFTLDISGPSSNIEAQISITSSWNHFLSVFGISAPLHTDIQMDGIYTTAIESSFISLKGQTLFTSGLEGEGAVAIGIKIPIECSDSFWGKQIKMEQIHGSCAINNLSANVYVPLLQGVSSNLEMSGTVGADIEIRPGSAICNIFSEGLFIHQGTLAFSTGPLEKETTQFRYDYTSDTWRADVYLQDGYFAQEPSQFSLSHIQGHLQWEHDVLKAPNMQAHCAHVQVPFSLYYDYTGLSLETHPMQTTIEELYKIEAIRSWVGYLGEKIEGSVDIPTGGCNILLQKSANGWLLHYKVAATLDRGSYSPASQVQIRDIECGFSFDSSTGQARVKQTHGVLDISGHNYDVHIDDFIFDPRKDSSFVLNISDSSMPLLLMSGRIKVAKDIDIIFDQERTQFCSLPLSVEVCRLSRDLSLQQLEVKGHLSSDDRLRFVSHLQAFPSCPAFIKSWVIKQAPFLGGSVGFTSSFKRGQGWEFDICGSEITWKTQAIDQLNAQATYHNQQFVIRDLRWNNAIIQTDVNWYRDRISMKEMRFSMPDAKVHLSADFLFGTHTLEVDSLKYSVLSSILPTYIQKEFTGAIKGQVSGTLVFDSDYTLDHLEVVGSFDSRLSYPFSWDIKTSKDFTAHYSKGEGCNIQGLDVRAFVKGTSEFIGKFTCQLLSAPFSEDKVLMKEGKLELHPKATESLASIGLIGKDLLYLKTDLDWKISGDLSWNGNRIEGSLSFPSGVYTILDTDHYLVTPQLQINPDSIYVRSKIEIANQVIFCDVQKDTTDDAPLFVLLRDSQDPSGMKIICKQAGGQFEPVRLEGKLLGLDLNLQKSAHIHDGSFFGLARIDCLKAKAILPSAIQHIIETLQLGPGYTVKGHFFLPDGSGKDYSFEGEIHGEQCGFLGYTLDSMIVRASINSSICHLEDIRIEDPAGHLSIKELYIHKDPFSNVWQLEMPLGHVREFKPSLLHFDGKRGAEKAFLINNLSIYELTGFLGDMKSFLGKGAFHFSSSNKKEFSVLDIPLELFKDLGLDLGILTPISGDVDFTIKKGRCMFLELKNSYSQGRRSEFYLSGDNLAYIDLQGNWHVDLKMKQHVLLKWSESLIVSIRGTLDKPKYSLKNIDDSL
ncbi:MAG: hypothetical protein NT065_06350 [Chlamydiae bacterium]|nr:hypothetical protein [Chlamydiota bacterium]